MRKKGPSLVGFFFHAYHQTRNVSSKANNQKQPENSRKIRLKTESDSQKKYEVFLKKLK